MSWELGNGLTAMGSPSVCFPPNKSLCRLELSVNAAPWVPAPGDRCPHPRCWPVTVEKRCGWERGQGGWLLRGEFFFLTLLWPLPIQGLILCKGKDRGWGCPRTEPGPALWALHTPVTWVRPVCSSTFSNINILINSRPIVLFFPLIS